METSKLQMGWGTLVVIISMLMVSSCAERKAAHESDTSFDYFVEECHPGYSSNIVGGQVVHRQDIDSNRSVLLFAKDKNGKQSICSSTLISDRTLLTAAHCVNEATQIQAIFYSDITCNSGYRRSQHAIQADNFVYHPGYNSDIKSLQFIDENPDLALVHLSQNPPANFPVFRMHQNPEALQSDIILYGYGITGTHNKDAMIMRKTVVKRPNLFYSNRALFFEQEYGAGVCKGDSGGAGLAEDNGELFVVSVNSEVEALDPLSDDACGGNGKAIVVHHYLNWINSVMSQWGESLK